MIPVHLKTPDFAEPDCPLYYLVTASGVFLVRSTALYGSVTRARSVSGLGDQKPALELALPKIPGDIVERVWGFFREVFHIWDGEAIAFLYFSREQRKYRVGIPPQTLFRYRTLIGWRTDMRLEYGYLERPRGYLKIGDIHSHGNLSAFFSQTDDEDDQEDGLRIIFGDVDRPEPDIRVSFVADHTRFTLKPDQILGAYAAPQAPPIEWLVQVTCRQEDYQGWATKEEGPHGQGVLPR
jgi:PRTRC genetic system protein A